MTRLEYLPEAALQQDLHCAWMLEEVPMAFNRDALLPDAYCDLIVNCSAPILLVQDNGTEIELPDVFLNHIQLAPMRLRASGICQIIALRLYPWAHPKAGTPMAGTSLVLLDAQWTRFAQSLRHTFHAGGYVAALDSLQEFFIDQAGTPTSPTLLRTVGQQIFDSLGQLHIHDLAAQHFFSISQIERIFKQHLGVTPKLFSRLVRFRAVCSRMMADPSLSVIDLAQQFGYTDQAHIIHEFKALAHRTPGQFIARMEAMNKRPDAENLQSR